jgi:hypothetical protein
MDALIGTTSHARPLSFDGSQRGEVDRITFSVATCDIGCVLVASSDVGICAILIGSDADEVTGDLSSRLSGSILERNDEALRSALGKVVRFISTPSEGLDLPLDIRGTPFQRRVYEALRTVRVERSSPMPRSPVASASRTRSVRLPVLARTTRSRLRSLATGLFERMVRLADIGGESSASAPCSTGRPCHERQHEHRLTRFRGRAWRSSRRRV